VTSPNYSLAARIDVCVDLPDWINETFENYNPPILGTGRVVCGGITGGQVQTLMRKAEPAKLCFWTPLHKRVGCSQICFTDKTAYCYFSFDVAQTRPELTVRDMQLRIRSTSATEIMKIHIQKSRLNVDHSAGNAV